MTMIATTLAAMLIPVSAGLAPPQTAPAGEKAQIVSVTGCLKEAGANNWMLSNATDPVPSRAGATVQPPSGPTSGKNEFKLIGVFEFNLAAQKDRTVVVKGLLVKAAPVNRLNITSVRAVAPACPAPPK